MINLKNYTKKLVSIKFLFGIILFSFIAVHANNSGDWFDKLSEIHPGATSRNGIEKLFEIEKVSKENTSFEQIDVSYSTNAGLLKVTYASGKGCSEVTNMGYKLGKDIVVNYFFAANDEIKFSRLELNLGDLTFNEWDNESERIYANPKTGIYYNIRYKEFISQVGQGLTLEQLRKYSCQAY